MKQNNIEDAVYKIIQWIGDDPDREGLKDTPKRIAKFYKEFFTGYNDSPEKILSTTFTECGEYKDMIVIKDINFESYCEHHLIPIIGTATIAYIPNNKVVGLSKLARLVDCYAKRLQIQERMTNQIAEAIDSILKPKGVAVHIEASHQCMSIRGVKKPHSTAETICVKGSFQEQATRTEFLNKIK